MKIHENLNEKGKGEIEFQSKRHKKKVPDQEIFKCLDRFRHFLPFSISQILFSYFLFTLSQLYKQYPTALLLLLLQRRSKNRGTQRLLFD